VAEIGIEDDDNNRLDLSPTIHLMFDGRRNQYGYARIPQIMIDPEPDFISNDNVTTAADSVGNVRVGTWVKLTGIESIDFEMISFHIKEGAQTNRTNDGFIKFFTFVFVRD